MLVLHGTCTARCWYCVLLVLYGVSTACCWYLYCLVLVLCVVSTARYFILRGVGTACCWYCVLLVPHGTCTVWCWYWYWDWLIGLFPSAEAADPLYVLLLRFSTRQSVRPCRRSRQELWINPRLWFVNSVTGSAASATFSYRNSAGRTGRKPRVPTDGGAPECVQPERSKVASTMSLPVQNQSDQFVICEKLFFWIMKPRSLVNDLSARCLALAAEAGENGWRFCSPLICGRHFVLLLISGAEDGRRTQDEFERELLLWREKQEGLMKIAKIHNRVWPRRDRSWRLTFVIDFSQQEHEHQPNPGSARQRTNRSSLH